MVKLKIFLVTFIFYGCSMVGGDLSQSILNQDKCALSNKEQVTIHYGDIRLLKNNLLIGQITIINNREVEIIDDQGYKEFFTVMVEEQDPKKKLIYLISRDKKILVACGLS